MPIPTQKIDTSTKAKLQWIYDHLSTNHDIDKQSFISLSIGFQDGDDIQLSQQFYEDLSANIFDHHHHMPHGPYISLPSGKIDYLSSIFYLVNSIQEYGCTDLDHYGRYKYENSLQKKWGIINQNIVWEYIQAFCQKHNISYDKKPVNSCFLTHDIDFIYSGWKTEGLWALKRGRVDTFGKIIGKKLMGKPIYANVVDIARREHKQGHKSNFYWITQSGKCEVGIKNADYHINDPFVRQQIDKSASLGSTHGLHKSTLHSSMESETSPFETPLGNRYHFLKFTLPEAYNELEKAGVKLDCSLGFAEHFGYRNSYGLPFRPYNLTEDRPYTFIEVPLHMMDGTFIYYMGMKQSEVAMKAKEWISTVRDHTLPCILWHNNELTSYSFGTMSKTYDDLLCHLSDLGMTSFTQQEILDRYFWES